MAQARALPQAPPTTAADALGFVAGLALPLKRSADDLRVEVARESPSQLTLPGRGFCHVRRDGELLRAAGEWQPWEEGR